MNDLKIREAAVSDIPQMCSLFQKDLGYAECTLEIVEKQFAGLDASREAVFVAEVQGRLAGVIHTGNWQRTFEAGRAVGLRPQNQYSPSELRRHQNSSPSVLQSPGVCG